MYINKEKKEIKKYIRNEKNCYFYNIKISSIDVEQRYIQKNHSYFYDEKYRRLNYYLSLEQHNKLVNCGFDTKGYVIEQKSNIKKKKLEYIKKLKKILKILKSKKYTKKKIIELFQKIKKKFIYFKENYILDFIYIKIYYKNYIFYADILFNLKSFTGINLIDCNFCYYNEYYKNLYKTKQILNFFKKQKINSLSLKIIYIVIVINYLKKVKIII
jgi:hypothetical protein